MRLAHRRGRFLGLTALVTLSSISADAVSNKFYVRFGKIAYASPFDIYIDYFDTDYPKVTVSTIAYSDSSMSTKLLTLPDESFTLDTNAEDPHWIKTLNVDSTLTTNYSSFYLTVTFDCSESTWWFPKTRKLVYTSEVTVPSSLSCAWNNPSRNVALHTGRTTHWVQNGAPALSEDLYCVGSWDPSMYDSGDHGLHIKDAWVAYSDSYEKGSLNFMASLVIFSNISDWNLGSVTVEKGRVMRVVPLKVELNSPVFINGREFTRYSARLPNPVIVSRVDLKMNPTDSNLVASNKFATTDVIVPVRTGHDFATYDFELRWMNLTKYQDSVTLSYRYTYSRQFFGNCDTADYCVGLGNPNK